MVLFHPFVSIQTVDGSFLFHNGTIGLVPFSHMSAYFIVLLVGLGSARVNCLFQCQRFGSIIAAYSSETLYTTTRTRIKERKRGPLLMDGPKRMKWTASNHTWIIRRIHPKNHTKGYCVAASFVVMLSLIEWIESQKSVCIYIPKLKISMTRKMRMQTYYRTPSAYVMEPTPLGIGCINENHQCEWTYN